MVAFVSDVLTFEKTSFAQRSCDLETSAPKFVPAGICVSTLLQAWSVEINEMPTRDDTLVALKVKTPPLLYIPRVEVELSWYHCQ